ncbi:hypothetical protein F5887DRAFT_936941 [Amanita rubescens]|nr:hypothetical protein F5887DRAFT_936941 [Amanita rubescens]
MLDLEDREGETALHRASLHGHLNIVRYLIGHEAEVHAIDADGWTALHNACSKGYLDIVRCLCENGNLEKTVDGVRGIDARNKDGWTPLMNASSKGHLPIVLYLIRQGADPLIRNKWGETAYDTAAAVFQVWICEVLQQVEAEHWGNSPIPYNPLAVHTAVPVIIYENQKLDTRLKTLAVSGPKFSASGLDRRERRPPFEIKFPKQPYSGAVAVMAWSDVRLPFRDAPWIFPEPSKPEKQTPATGDHSHFWLSEWIVDVTHPKVDVKDGWQYAHHFTDADEQWTAEKPLSLQRVLKDGGVVASSVRTVQNWVRRRRWVRIMRRRIDIPPLPFLQADGDMYHLASDGTLIPYVDEKSQDDGGKELGPIAPTFLPSAQDYVARARYLVGNQTSDGDADYPSSTAAELRLSVFKLEDATAELRRGILDDEDGDRKTQAEVLFNAYNRGLERLRLAASARGWFILSEDDSEGDDDGSDFHYPIPPMEDYQSISTSDTLTAGVHTDDSRSVSRASTITAYAVSPTDFTPQLSKAPDFRVPTHEAPQVGLSSKGPLLQQSVLWERDEKVSNCRDCNCRFGLLTRRQHCRKCGRIFCDNCSAFRALLDPPQVPGRLNSPKSSNLQRVCRACYADVTESLSFQDKKATMEPIIININQLNGSSASRGQACRFGNLLLCVFRSHLFGCLLGVSIDVQFASSVWSS